MIPTLSVLALLVCLVLLRAARNRRRVLRQPRHPEPAAHGFARKKPEWVRREVIRLKALMPHEGCRHVARAFNSLYAARKHESVGKSYVADTVKRQALQVLALRREIKNRRRRQGPRNRTWAMDLTFVGDDSPPVLGILDHGTRSLLALRELRVRTAIGVLRVLLDVIEKFGKPRFLRTDNEGIFASRLLTLALFALGIRPQRIDPFCPWQNGRIERLFETLKQRLRLWWVQAGAPSDPQHDLDTFRIWYNHARPHQSLEGLTPAMAWAGVTKPGPRLRLFQAWDAILAGFVPL